MRIAICDDEQQQREMIAGYLQPYKKIFANLSVEQFDCGEALLASLAAGQVFDFYFLDIQMKDINGIQTGQEIRKHSQHAILFFITSFTRYVSAAFTLNAFQFLVKPVKQESFDREFRRAVNKYLTAHKKYPIENKSRIITLEIQDLVYLESSAHHIIVYTDANEYIKPGKLNDEEKSLSPYGFVRTHQGFLVNMAYIFEIGQENILLTNGSTAMVSIRKRTEVLQKYNKYLTGCVL
jgi:DNA-binding LytR/AlgR family response regulator